MRPSLQVFEYLLRRYSIPRQRVRTAQRGNHFKNPFYKRQVMPSVEEVIEAGVDPKRWLAYQKGWYDGSIRAMDMEVNRLIEKLRGLGLV